MEKNNEQFDHELFKVMQEAEKTKEADWEKLKEKMNKPGLRPLTEPILTDDNMKAWEDMKMEEREAKLTPEQIKERKSLIEWYRNPAGTIRETIEHILLKTGKHNQDESESNELATDAIEFFKWADDKYYRFDDGWWTGPEENYGEKISIEEMYKAYQQSNLK